MKGLPIRPPGIQNIDRLLAKQEEEEYQPEEVN